MSQNLDHWSCMRWCSLFIHFVGWLKLTASVLWYCCEIMLRIWCEVKICLERVRRPSKIPCSRSARSYVTSRPKSSCYEHNLGQLPIYSNRHRSAVEEERIRTEIRHTSNNSRSNIETQHWSIWGSHLFFPKVASMSSMIASGENTIVEYRVLRVHIGKEGKQRLFNVSLVDNQSVLEASLTAFSSASLTFLHNSEDRLCSENVAWETYGDIQKMYQDRPSYWVRMVLLFKWLKSIWWYIAPIARSSLPSGWGSASQKNKKSLEANEVYGVSRWVSL